MASSVAENPVAQKPAQGTRQALGVASLVGGIVVLLALQFVFGSLAYVWNDWLLIPDALKNPFLASTLYFFVALIVGVVIAFGLYRLEQNQHMPGLRAGSFWAALSIFVIAWIGFTMGDGLAVRYWTPSSGLVVLAIVCGGLLFAIFRLFQTAGFQDWLRGQEASGWFHAVNYKANQGLRVRRSTIFALLMIGIAGILSTNLVRSLGTSSGPEDWYWNVPWTGSPPKEKDAEKEKSEKDKDKDEPVKAAEAVSTAPEIEPFYVPLINHTSVVVPLLLFAALIWFSWRLVSYPPFADFLIATEAEMNKVSWTTRKRLYQDTIVVMVTVLLFTLFLFFVDVMWVKILNNPYINVLSVNLQEEQQKQMEKTQW